MAVASDRHSTINSQKLLRSENPVAQIRLRRRTQSNHRFRIGYLFQFVVIQVCRVNQTPLLIHIEVVQQKRDRTLPVNLLAIVNLFGLFGDMNMNRTAVIDCFDY